MDKLPPTNPQNSQNSQNPYSNAIAIKHIVFCGNKQYTITNKGKPLNTPTQQCICRLQQFNKYNLEFRQKIQNIINTTRNIKSTLPPSWNPKQPTNIKINVGTTGQKIEEFLSIKTNQDCIGILPREGGSRKTRRRRHSTRSTRTAKY